MFDLVIFDCDGTLADSENLNNQAMLDVLHEDGFVQYDMAYALKHWLGTTVTDSVRQIESETGKKVSGDAVARYMKRVHELHQAHLKPVAGAASLVGACGARMKICVASNGERNNVLQSLQITGLMPFFTPDSVFTKIQVPRPKPAPDLFLYAAEKMGAVPARCLVVEDSPAGVAAGRAAGMTVWGFTGTHHDPAGQSAALLNAGADNIFARLEQMTDLIDDFYSSSSNQTSQL